MIVSTNNIETSPHLPTYLDRYPAKMVARLADSLVSKYVTERSQLLDPFCGSGAILVAGKGKGASVTGFDINPYAVLLSRVKLDGFNSSLASDLCSKLVMSAWQTEKGYPIKWDEKHYWFTPATIKKYERLRYVANKMNLSQSREGRAVLLAYALSVRRCSRADQRSPKPFISKTARERRRGHHFDPFKEIKRLLDKMTTLYSFPKKRGGKVEQVNFVSIDGHTLKQNSYTHAVTSPPYINAQDYFRNSKLELYLLEGVLPFHTESIRDYFIGTERGLFLQAIQDTDKERNRQLLPCLKLMEVSHPKSAAIVHRYLYDMGKCFDALKRCLVNDGVLVLVCGDNLVAGHAIPTWRLLNHLLEERGFNLFDSYGDKIDRRALAPKRNGHKGLIKEEVVSAFKLVK